MYSQKFHQSKNRLISTLIIRGYILSTHFLTCSFLTQDLTSFSIMEDLDTRLFIASVEVSCWQDQLKQAVSISYLSISRSYFINFHFIY